MNIPPRGFAGGHSISSGTYHSGNQLLSQYDHRFKKTEKKRKREEDKINTYIVQSYTNFPSSMPLHFSMMTTFTTEYELQQYICSYLRDGNYLI